MGNGCVKVGVIVEVRTAICEVRADDSIEGASLDAELLQQLELGVCVVAAEWSHREQREHGVELGKESFLACSRQHVLKAVDGHDHWHPKLLDVLDMSLEIAEALLQQLKVLEES